MCKAAASAPPSYSRPPPEACRGTSGFVVDDNPHSVEVARKAADEGDAHAQYTLGTMYAGGRGGLAKDDFAALGLYRAAAEQGYGPASLAIGLMTFEGRAGLAKDEAKSAELIRAVAEKQGYKGWPEPKSEEDPKDDLYFPEE